MAYEIDPANVVASSPGYNVTPGSPYDQYDVDENGNVVIKDSPVPQVATQAPPPPPASPDEIMAMSTGQPAPVAPPQTTMTSSGQGMSASSSAFSPNMFDVVDAKSRKGMSKDMADANNLAASYETKLNAGQDAIAETQKTATENITKLEAEKMDMESQLAHEQAGAERQMALDNEVEYAKVQAKTATYMADYEASVMDLANSTPNPGRAYSNMSSLAQAGTAMTAFVQDFLGARGIKSNGLNLIHQAVDMDLQAQRDAYNGKVDFAKGKLNIYQLHKEQGDSDYLASVKTRATLLEAVKMEATAKLSAMNSPIALAKIPLLQAQIDEEHLKLKAEAAKSAMGVYENAAQRAVTLNGQRLSAAMESKRLTLENRKLDMAKAAADDAKKNALPPNVKPELFVRDIAGRVAIQAPNETTRNDLQIKVTGAEHFVKHIAKLADDVREAGHTYAGFGSDAFKSIAEAKYMSDYHAAISDYVKAQSGAQASDKEADRLMKVLPFESFMTGVLSGDDGQSIVQGALANQGYQRVDDLLETVTAQGMPVDRAIAEQFKGGITEGAFAETKARGTQFEITNRGDAEASKTAVDKAIGIADSRGEKNSQMVKVPEDERPGLDLSFATGEKDPTEQTLLMWNAAKEAGVLDEGEDIPADYYNHAKYRPPQVPRWLIGMDELAKIALDPTQPQAEQERAGLALISMTHTESLTGKPSKDEEAQALAAFYYLQQITDRNMAASKRGY
jgi:hypothetical protein